MAQADGPTSLVGHNSQLLVEKLAGRGAAGNPPNGGIGNGTNGADVQIVGICVRVLSSLVNLAVSSSRGLSSSHGLVVFEGDIMSCRVIVSLSHCLSWSRGLIVSRRVSWSRLSLVSRPVVLLAFSTPRVRL